MSVQNLFDIYKSYVDKLAKERGTTVDWLQIDRGWCLENDYPKRGLIYDVRKEHYEKSDPFHKPNFAYSAVYENNGSEVMVCQFNRQVETVDSYSWQVTRGMETTITLDVTVSPPFVDIHAGMSQTFSMSTTEEHTTTKTQTWQANQEIRVPPHKKVKATLVIDEDICDWLWTAEIKITGDAVVKYNDAIDVNDETPPHKSKYWCPPITNVVLVMKPPNFRYDWDDAVIFNGGGSFKASQGVSSRVRVDEYDLDTQIPENHIGGAEHSNVKPTKTYYIPVSGVKKDEAID